MIDLKRIFPECDADTLLVQLVLQRGLPVHCKGISKVAGSLERISNNNVFVLGLVDNDKLKNVPTFIRNFKEYENKVADEKLTILNLAGTQKFIVRLHPGFEKWILFVADSCDVKPENYGFEDFEKFKNAAKGESVYENKEFKKFLNEVIQKNPPAIQTLKYWLNKANT